MMFCKNCGQGNPDDAAFCAQCGAGLEAGAQDIAPGGPGEAEGIQGVTSPPPPATPTEGAVPPPPGAPGQPPPPPGLPVAPIAGPPPGGPPPVGPPGFAPPPGAPPGAPPGPPYPQYVAPRRQNETEPMAIASLALAVAGWFMCPLLSILSLIFGYMARNKVRESGGRLKGDDIALAGIIISWVLVGLILLVVAIILIGIGVGWWQSSTSMLMPLQVALVGPLQAGFLLVA